jgi:hypothetical protein
MTKFELKLSGVPNRSGAIWWHTVHETLSAASRCSGEPPAVIGRCANTCPCPPPARSIRALIGMWQAAHSSWMAAACFGWSIVSRRTPACQYGSRAEFAIIVERHVAPIDTSSPDGAVSPLWHATQLSEWENSVKSACAFLPPARGEGCWAAVVTRHVVNSHMRQPSGTAKRSGWRRMRVTSRTGTGRRRTSPRCNR